ncbi:MAG: hypothetical protein JXR14_03685 [Paracoccaceae bacterium]
MKLRFFLAIALCAVTPVLASADPVVKCLQRELRASGHNPRGVDGIIGPNTLAAAASWARKREVDLPELDPETAPRWCGAILASSESVPEPEPGTGRYCIWFEDVHSGVWLDSSGVPVLSFRYSLSNDRAGCYAWLNLVEDWQITEPGLQIVRVDREDNLWSSGDEENGIFVDKDLGSARYVQNGFTTVGVLTDLAGSASN